MGTMNSPKSSKKVVTATSHLAALAPKNQDQTEKRPHSPLESAHRTISVPKSRLPPRSRLGCWTCRTRKVKCDEKRPRCTPCARLGHQCDYSPRLTFKDDTLRVVQRLSGARGASGPVWNQLTEERHPQRRPEDDLLPLFAALANDEEREMKAEFRKPGSYHVIVNPSSFEDYGEPVDQFNTDTRRPCTQLHSSDTRVEVDQISDSAVQSIDRCTKCAQNLRDPDIIVLKVFEDESSRLHQRPSENLLDRERTCEASTLMDPSSSSLVPSTRNSGQQEKSSEHSSNNWRSLHCRLMDGKTHDLLGYFRTVINPNLIQVHRDSLSPWETTSVFSANAFEQEAARFPPLHHALLAFSALSMSRRSGSNPGLTSVALEHYQQSLPSLQASLCSEKDLASDGIFLTHFMLLLYELAAGEPSGMSLWQQHITQLLRIVLLRRTTYDTEAYSFLIWWVAVIDTHIVLNGLGNGSFVETMLYNDLLPFGQCYHDNNGLKSSLVAPLSFFCPCGLSCLGPPSALAFHRRICNLAARLSLLSRDLRAEISREPTIFLDETSTAQRRKRVNDLHNLLCDSWNSEITDSTSNFHSNPVIPIGGRGSLEHSYALHRALVIYLHTSLPISASISGSSERSILATRVRSAAHDILQFARVIVARPDYEHEFIVFPLFMAGYVFPRSKGEVEIIRLLKKFEANGIGKNVIATRTLLELIYDRREQRGISCDHWETGTSIDDGGGYVDWIALMREMGWQIVNIG